jgi:microcystin-dependent protein
MRRIGSVSVMQDVESMLSCILRDHGEVTMSDPFLGQIIQGGWNFAPRGWAFCNGSLMAISQNTALFSLLGTQYGGNGQTTFGLPDLRGRTMIGSGQGPGLAPYSNGEMAGTENTTLTLQSLPQHTHTATFASTASLNASTTKATSQVPQNGGPLGRGVDGDDNPNALPFIYCPANTATSVALGGLNVAGTVTVQPTGSGLPFSILSPFNTVTMVIALQGIFPSRS